MPGYGAATDPGETARADSTPPPHPGDSGLLTPTSRAVAVAGLALAVAGLLGQNVLTTGVQFLLVGGGGSQDLRLYSLVLGLGAAVPALLALALAWGPARRTASASWPAHAARAAVVVACLVLLGAVLTALGGIVHPY